MYIYVFFKSFANILSNTKSYGVWKSNIEGLYMLFYIQLLFQLKVAKDRKKGDKIINER